MTAARRRIPHDEEAERSLIAALIVRPQSIAAAAPHVAPADFYDPALAGAYRAIIGLAADGEPIDLITLARRLNGAGEHLDLPELVAGAAGISNPAAYAQIVADLARRRRAQSAALELDQALQDPAADLTAAIAGHMERLGELGRQAAASSSWEPIDLTDALVGGRSEAPQILARADGHCLLYPGKTHALNGESESLKSWLALCAVAQCLAAGHTALYVDFEDNAYTIVSRLLALAIPGQAILDGLLYMHPDEPIGGASGAIEALLDARTPALCIVDGVTEALALHGLDLNDNLDYARFHAAVPKRLASRGAAVACIDHVVKNQEQRGRFAIGAQHKLAAIDGAAFSVDVLQPFGKGREGKARLTVAKDRPGGVREHSAGGRIAGLLSLKSWPDGGITWHLDPVAEHDPEHPFEPTKLMERLSRALEAEPGLSGRALRSAVKGNHDARQHALEILCARGYVAAERGPRGAQQYRSERPYREPSAEGARPPDPGVYDSEEEEF